MLLSCWHAAVQEVQEAARLGRRHCLALCAAAEALLRMAAATRDLQLVAGQGGPADAQAAGPTPPTSWQGSVAPAARRVAALAGKQVAAEGGSSQMDAGEASAQLQALCRLAASSLKAAQLACPPTDSGAGTAASIPAGSSRAPAASGGRQAGSSLISSDFLFQAISCLLGAAGGSVSMFLKQLPDHLQAEQLR